MSSHLRGFTDFFSDMAGKTLPKGGVFYIRGGYTNQAGLLPAVTHPGTPQDEVDAINAAKAGDDDHPAYTGRQISEAMPARVINAIAANHKIWKQCAAVITYDESDGFYDHVPPRILSYGPNGLPLSRGVRVPLILISPYARTHAVSHVEGDHNAIIETINEIFGLPPLARLPDEAQALAAGKVLPGPTVFIESHAVMVAADAAAQHVGDLAGESICYMIGSPVERSLAAYCGGLHQSYIHRAFSEKGEMADTCIVHNCHAIAGEITDLAAIRLNPGINHLTRRILPEKLAVFPVMAVTGTDDAQWSAIVAWTGHTLISAERPQTHGYAGGAGPMPISAPELGLDPGWQQRVLAAVGNYGDIYRRNLGSDAALNIKRGLNANQINAGLLLGPILE